MIKVLQVVTSTGIGGAEAVSINIGKEIDKTVFRVDYLTYNFVESSFINEIGEIGTLHKTPFPPKKNLFKFYLFLKDFFNKNYYDVVHFHTNYLSWIGVLAAKKAGISKIVCHSHSASHKGIIPTFFRQLTKIMTRKKVINLACSENAGKCLFGNNHFTFFHNGVVVSDYLKDNIEFCNDFHSKIGEEKKIICHIGRFENMKNHSFMLQLAREADRNGFPWTFVFAGQGPLFECIKKEAKELIDKGLVCFLGNVSYVPDLLKASDVFILPSLWEALPVSAVEAQCAGIPVLLSNHITKEVICSNSYVVHLPLEVPIWKNEIEKALAIRIDRQLAVEGVIDTGFSMKDEVKKLQAIYSSL